jgi:hypothetical protein
VTADPRKDTRDALFGQKSERPTKVIEVNGRKIKIVQPRVGPYTDSMGKLLDDKGRVRDALLFQFECVRLSAFDAETGDALFEVSDMDAVRSLPLHCQWFETLARECVGICTTRAQEDAQGLGEAAPANSSSR